MNRAERALAHLAHAAAPPPGLHAGVIMDGNGRWAAARGLPRIAGHRAGRLAVERAVEAAPDLGIGTLTLYAFSADNWKRPRDEVAALMRLMYRYLRRERDRCVDKGVRIEVIGRRDRLHDRLVAAIHDAEAATAGGERLLVRLAVDYSSREAITRAAHLAAGRQLTPEAFSRLVCEAIGSDPRVPPVDFVVRTSGEKRLSDFLLWESAYAELIFTDTLWPDFDRDDLERAVAEFRARERRFGAVVAAGPAV